MADEEKWFGLQSSDEEAPWGSGGIAREMGGWPEERRETRPTDRLRPIDWRRIM